MPVNLCVTIGTQFLRLSKDIPWGTAHGAAPDWNQSFRLDSTLLHRVMVNIKEYTVKCPEMLESRQCSCLFSQTTWCSGVISAVVRKSSDKRQPGEEKDYFILQLQVIAHRSRNFKQLATSHPWSRAERDECMLARTSSIAPFMLPMNDAAHIGLFSYMK